MPQRKACVLLNMGRDATWSVLLANESRGPDGAVKYDAILEVVPTFPIAMTGETELEREREFERVLLAALPGSQPAEHASLPLEVEVCVDVAESVWMPQAALRVMTQWLARIGRPDGRCMVWNVRTDRGPSHGCGALMWNEHLILNLTGFAAECLVSSGACGTLNSCPTRIGDDGALELVLDGGFMNDVAVALMNSLARGEHPRSATLLLPHPGNRLSHQQAAELATSLLSRISLLCFGALGRSLPSAARTLWTH